MRSDHLRGREKMRDFFCVVVIDFSDSGCLVGIKGRGSEEDVEEDVEENEALESMHRMVVR